MKKSILIIVLLIITIVAFYIYFSTRLPAGVESKGSDTTVALISLITAIISLLGTVLTVILKIIELRVGKTARDVN